MKRVLPSLFLIGSFLFAGASFGQVTANFSYPNGCLSSTTVQFTDMSQSATGTITTWLWNFGDGNTSVVNNPIHTYAATGTYTVILTVKDNMNNQASDAVVFTLKVKPIASFSINDTSQCLRNNSFNFINTSTIAFGVLNYNWSFGDTGVSTLQDPVHHYATPGAYNVKLVTASNLGCKDSLMQLVKVLAPTASTTYISKCAFQLPFVWNGNFYNAPGTYLVTLVNSVGCDSIAQLNLSVREASASTTNISICATQLPFLWNGNTYTAQGAYTILFVNSAGCDSSATLNLTVKAASSSDMFIDVCPAQLPYIFNGYAYSISGIYKDTLTAANGCDSILTLHLNVKPASFSTTDVTICPAQLPYTWNGNSYNSSGYYIVTFPDPGGCDSIAYLNLSVRDSIYHDTAVNICSSQLPYVWNGTSYNASGVYLKVFTSSTGCDSVARLFLSVFLNTSVANFSTAIADNACGSMSRIFYGAPADTYHWDFGDGSTATGDYTVHVYQSYGAYIVKLVAGNICRVDSILRAINIIPEANTLLPAVPHTLFANRECTAADSLWTNYYFDNNTPGNTNDDTLLLSIKKNGNYIGNVNDGTFQVKLVATQGAGSNTGILLTNPLITNPSGFWVMNRYWNVTPSQQPASPVGIKFYFNTQDLNDVNGSFPTHNLAYSDLMFYKTIGGNPDPTSNLAGATAVTGIVNGTTADTTHWIYSSLGTGRHVSEFAVSHFSGGGGGATVNGQILPLKLVSFDAHKNNKTVVLQWITGAEMNLENFEVQRSANGADFAAIGNVAATGIVDRTSYVFTDNMPLQTSSYYRLKITDKDGSFTFSPARKITNNAFEIAIYPNPVRNIFSVKIESDSRKNVRLEILSIEGKVLQTIKTIAGNGTFIKSLNVSNLNTGSYFIKVTSDNDNVIMKFEKM